MTRFFLLALACLSICVPAWDTSGCAGETDAPKPRRPQEPKRPFPYVEEEVSFDNPRAKVKLAGTLTRPKGDGPFPAVILLAGTGPHTRDNEGVPGHRWFLVLSDYLTRRGLAVLRYDKRGTGKSTGDYKQAVILDFAEDAIAGMEYLKSRRDIDPKRIGGLGLSEGAATLPTVAAGWPDTAFVVMLAGTPMTGEEILARQFRLMAEAKGANKEELARHHAFLKAYSNLAKRGTERAEMERQLRPLLESLKNLDESPQDILPVLLLPGTRFFLTHSCAPDLEKLCCPVLALNGSKDLQVPAKESLQGIARALAKAGNTDFAIREMPELNHLFQRCKTGLPSEYEKIEETMSPEMQEVVGDWILQHVPPAR